jgi:regulator of RNase E activity RraA
MTVKELVEGFRNVATASVADAVDMIVGKRGYMDYSIKPRINSKKVVGPAVTILEGSTEEVLPPTHALDAIDESPEGSVIVIGINGDPTWLYGVA